VSSAPPGPPIAVFGASDAAPDSAAYRQALEVGRRLAEAGYAVVNGGYGGTMEASARGAAEAGGRAIGVTTRAFASLRTGGNRFLTEERSEADLFDRTRTLIETAAGFIVLPGKSGTLAELAFLWALHRAGLLGGKPILLLGAPWAELLGHLERLRLAGVPELRATQIAASPEEAIALLRRALAAAAPGAGRTGSGGR
jgi:uncharacterized protein (TIGR00730 family)